MTGEKQGQVNGGSTDQPDVVGAVRRALQSAPPIAPEVRDSIMLRMSADVDAIAREHKLRRQTRGAWWTTWLQPIRWRFAAAAAVSMAAGIALVWFDASTNNSTISETQPAVAELRFLSGAHSRAGLVLEREDTAAGELFHVPADAIARLDLDNVVDMSLLGPAELSIQGWIGKDLTTRLSSGRLMATYHHQAGTRLVLHVEGVKVVVVGTLFSVERPSPGEVEVGVLSGRVQVECESGTAMVTAGMQWSGGIRGGELAALTPDVRRRLLSHQAVFLPRSGTEGNLVVDGQPLEARVTVDGIALGNAPLAVRWPAGTAQVQIDAVGMEPDNTRVLVTTDQTTRVDYALRLFAEGAQHNQGLNHAKPAQPSFGTADASATVAAESLTANSMGLQADLPKGAEEAYLRAETAMLSGAILEAQGILEALIDGYPKTPQALTAHLDLARLLVDSLGDPSEALRLVENLLERPDVGVLKEPALSLRCHILMEHRPQHQGRLCAVEFLHEFPDSPNAPALRAMLKETARQATQQTTNGDGNTGGVEAVPKSMDLP
ncbi:MAG: hypothetical protein A2289_14795 [Deltaproteobacteria bacterium RIFOXYA12_FULL_58_15]|nr:MAG: hypothetical protein A2289_14795 [Deltaproteobacteria bacterium RIFOXYA12_FULL_58_15]